MRIFTLSMLVLSICLSQNVLAQETQTIEQLKKQKELVEKEEREALKKEVESINERLDKKEVTFEEAQKLKKEAAKNRALNIENRVAILNNQIALLERKNKNPKSESEGEWVYLQERNENYNRDKQRKNKERHRIGDRNFSINWNRNYDYKYDRRTYSQLVVAVGFNNALIDGENIGDSPYRLAGSRFFELGWAWRTRVFDNSNFLRLKYGVSLQWNGLKPMDNKYFVDTDGVVTLEEFPEELNKSKFRMDNIVIPIHLEFGASTKRKSEKSIRYYTRKKFKLGLGGYAGFNMGTRQKLKYRQNGERVKDKIRRDYNTSNLVYGLSGYLSFGSAGLYVKYDLSPIFKDQVVDQHNISVGVRFDMD